MIGRLRESRLAPMVDYKVAKNSELSNKRAFIGYSTGDRKIDVHARLLERIRNKLENGTCDV